jgi:hypothetical protein
VKNIQAGFLTLPTLTRLPILSLSKDSGFFVKALIPKAWGRDYSGGSVPEFPTYAGSRGSLYLDIAVFDNLANSKGICQVFSLFLCGKRSGFLEEKKTTELAFLDLWYISTYLMEDPIGITFLQR